MINEEKAGWGGAVWHVAKTLRKLQSPSTEAVD